MGTLKSCMAGWYMPAKYLLTKYPVILDTLVKFYVLPNNLSLLLGYFHCPWLRMTYDTHTTFFQETLFIGTIYKKHFSSNLSYVYIHINPAIHMDIRHSVSSNVQSLKYVWGHRGINHAFLLGNTIQF